MGRTGRGCCHGSGFLDYVQVEVRVSTVNVLLHGSSYHGKGQSLLSLWIPPPQLTAWVPCVLLLEFSRYSSSYKA